jgi:hypothetical protein
VSTFRRLNVVAEALESIPGAWHTLPRNIAYPLHTMGLRQSEGISEITLSKAAMLSKNCCRATSISRKSSSSVRRGR